MVKKALPIRLDAMSSAGEVLVMKKRTLIVLAAGPSKTAAEPPWKDVSRINA